MKIKDIKDVDTQRRAIVCKHRQAVSSDEDLKRAFVWRLTWEGHEFWKSVNEGVICKNANTVLR